MNDIQVGAVRGIRLFRGQPDGRLRSYSAGYVWTRGVNEARCKQDRGRGHGAVPALGCGCGFWMYQDLTRCARMFRTELIARSQDHNGFGRFEPEHYAILGECHGWGRVLEGDDGWRVQYASVNALLDIGQDIDLGPWAGAYDVPTVAAEVNLALVHTGHLTALGEEVGQPLRTGIRVGDRQLVVRTDASPFFDLWKIPLGTLVRVRLDPETDEVVAVRTLHEDDM